MTDALLYLVGVTLADHGTTVRDACEAAVYLAAARTEDPRKAVEVVNMARRCMGAEPVPQIGEWPCGSISVRFRSGSVTRS